MMQPHRIGIVQRRAEEFAAVNGLRAEFLRSVYELLIEEACRLEDEIIGTPPRAG
jgi:chorismate mutase